jgi:predicted DNA-binding protein
MLSCLQESEIEKQTSMTKRTLFLPDELWAALGRLSTKTGAPIAELVRRAIIAYLKKEGESR